MIDKEKAYSWGSVLEQEIWLKTSLEYVHQILPYIRQRNNTALGEDERRDRTILDSVFQDNQQGTEYLEELFWKSWWEVHWTFL